MSESNIKPCKKCGGTERYANPKGPTYLGHCIKCTLDAQARTRQRHPLTPPDTTEQKLARKREYNQAHKEERAAYRKTYYQNHKEEELALNAEYMKGPERYAYEKTYWAENKERLYQRQQEIREANQPRSLLNQARAGARQRGLPFNLRVSDILIPGNCPLLGIPLIWSPGKKRCDNHPSVDRMDNKKGYVKGNVWIISYRANWLKCNATVDELELMASNLRLYNDGLLAALADLAEVPRFYPLVRTG